MLPTIASPEQLAAKDMDWMQVILNGGPPCFFIEEGRFCLRAKRWEGHNNEVIHPFVSLAELLTALTAAAVDVAVEVPGEPYLYAMEGPNGEWMDGESCVFTDRQSAQDEVDDLNDRCAGHKVVPLFRRVQAQGKPDVPTPRSKGEAWALIESERIERDARPVTDEQRLQTERDILIAWEKARGRGHLRIREDQ